MSWKSLVSAGLLCVVASPVFAVPSLQVSNGGLDASGNWIWNVTITPTGSTSPVAGELGFRETTAGSQLLSATKGAQFTGANTDNPGADIFGTNVSGDWEVHTDVDDTAGVNMKPVGLQTNAATDEVFAALGSIADVSGATQYVTITTAGPTSARLGSSIQVLGGYSGNGRIAEITSGTNSTNYSNFAGTATRTALLGDLNLSGNVSGADLADLASNFGKAGNFGWAQGDLNGSTGGSGEVSGADLADLASRFGQSGGTNTPLNVTGVAGGAALGAGAAVAPEPASVALAALALLGGIGMTLRRRQK